MISEFVVRIRDRTWFGDWWLGYGTGHDIGVTGHDMGVGT